MNDSDSTAADLCECQRPGDFFCGVPGVLAHVENGRVSPDCRVERCDFCRRIASDAAAEDRLRRLGMFAPADPRAFEPAGRQTFTVHCFVVVRVKLPPIDAVNPKEAARQARDGFDWDRYQARAEFAGDFTQLLVAVDGDSDFRDPRRFTPELTEMVR